MPRVPGRRIPFLPRSEREEEGLLDALREELPEADREPQLASRSPDTQSAGREDINAFVGSLGAETQVFILGQFARLRAKLDVHAPSPLEVAQARALVAGLREENARLLRQVDLYERAFRRLRELASDVEEASR